MVAPSIEEGNVDKTLIDWSTAPDWAQVVVASEIGTLAYAEFFEGPGTSKRKGLDDDRNDSAGISYPNYHRWRLIERRPATEVVQPAIRSLEERIKARAITQFGFELEEVMRKLRTKAGQSELKPSGIDGLNIREAIDLVYAAIVREQGPVFADEAVDDALEKLTASLDSKQNFMILTEFKR